MRTKCFLLHKITLFVGFKMIYCNPISGLYFFLGSILEKFGNFLKNGHFSGRIWPDWGNVARADMAGLGSIGLKIFFTFNYTIVGGKRNFETLKSLRPLLLASVWFMF